MSQLHDRSCCAPRGGQRFWLMLVGAMGVGLLWPWSNGVAVGKESSTVAPARVELHTIEMKLLERTNQERARHGRPPLQLDFSLLRSARRHAAWMVHRRSLQHTSAAVAENIAMGQHSSGQVVQDWMNSPGHRANILNPGYRRVGVAAYRAPNGTVYWCQQFL